MKIPHSAWIHISLAILIAVAALFLIRLHDASGIPPLAVVMIR
ncbi:hypothetical protein [Bradyrhizobium sp.]|jgi:hypothetical protein|nr:hypothetical protein [Bradyrhizobium sp.]